MARTNAIRVTRLAGIVAVVLLMSIGTAGAADPWLGEPATADHLEISHYYTDDNQHVGNFPGKLVCLRCDLGDKPCEGSRHRHSLLMDGVVHPLVTGTKEVQAEVNDPKLNGKQVIATGKYYPDTGMIFVNSLKLAQ